MKKILFLLFVSLAALGQRNGIIDADTTTRPRAGLSALAFSSGQLKIIRNTGNSYGVITSNNTYANPGWLSSIALAKVTGIVAALGAKSDTSHTHTTAKITDWTAAWASRFAAQSTSVLAEGSNLYYTDARVGTYSDGRYGRLASANSWTGSNTMSPTLSGTSGIESALTASPTIAQSSTAGYRGVFVSPFEQSTGSGAKLPLDVGTNSAANGAGTHTSRFSVASNGEINFGTLGRMFSDGNWFLGSSPVNAGYKLDVNGTARVSGNLTVTSIEATSDGGGNVGIPGKAFSSVRAITFFTDNIRSRTGIGMNFTTDTGVSYASQLPTGNFHFQNGGTYTDIPSARVAINSTNQGFLPPRMTQTQRNAISSPATGLTLYCTDCTATDASTGVMQTYNGSTWKNNW